MNWKLLFVLLLLLLPAAAQAKDGQKSLGTFGKWQAFTYKENDQPVCYMVKAAKFPVSQEAKKKSKLKRGATYLMITHRPAENNKDVVSYVAGYNFKPASDATVTVGKNSFDLFTNKDTAWSRDPKTDHALTAAIRSNSLMKVSALPAQSGAHKIVDNLDLTGSEGAYRAINKACGYETETPKKTVITKKKHKK